MRKDANPQRTAFNRIYISNHYREKSGGILTLDIFISIATKNCVYCGSEPRRYNPYGSSYDSYKRIYKHAVKEETFNNYVIYANGIDKVVDAPDYSNLSNLEACCSICNFFKRRYGRETFLNHVAKIYNYQMSIK